jgi:lantibiotic modifying enzyme|tara:strand:+ start:611 stop:823 length:213 start_codon:yes stop_codon:yes gene_type:complete
MKKILTIKKKSSYDKIIDKIQNVRKENNKNWMDILRLAFKSNPKAASKILSSIYKEDKKVSSLAKQLTKV